MAKRQNPRPNTASGSAKRQSELIDFWSPRLQAAHRLWNSGQHQDALTLFAEAVRQESNNVQAYVKLARAYAEKFDFGSMDRIHEMLIRRGPRHPGVHHYIGETYGQLKLPIERSPVSKKLRNFPARARQLGWSLPGCTNVPIGSTKPKSSSSERCGPDTRFPWYCSCGDEFNGGRSDPNRPKQPSAN